MNCKQEHCGVSYEEIREAFTELDPQARERLLCGDWERKPRLLDLYCGAGGATKGYQEAGFEVVGVDINPQPNYVGDEFRRMDALEALERISSSDYDAIHASPPCQRHTVALKNRPETQAEHPELIVPTRELLEQIGVPYVIENVEGAPLKEPVMLCGHMAEFPELRVIRHRLFETNWDLSQPEHISPHPLCYTSKTTRPHYGKLDEWESYVSVTGGGNCSVECARDAMGIEWMTKAELNQSIPPAYTKYIGERLIEDASPVTTFICDTPR